MRNGNAAHMNGEHPHLTTYKMLTIKFIDQNPSPSQIQVQYTFTLKLLRQRPLDEINEAHVAQTRTESNPSSPS
jgi:hypothetical protein